MTECVATFVLPKSLIGETKSCIFFFFFLNYHCKSTRAFRPPSGRWPFWPCSPAERRSSWRCQHPRRSLCVSPFLGNAQKYIKHCRIPHRLTSPLFQTTALQYKLTSWSQFPVELLDRSWDKCHVTVAFKNTNTKYVCVYTCVKYILVDYYRLLSKNFNQSRDNTSGSRRKKAKCDHTLQKPKGLK